MPRRKTPSAAGSAAPSDAASGDASIPPMEPVPGPSCSSAGRNNPRLVGHRQLPGVGPSAAAGSAAQLPDSEAETSDAEDSPIVAGPSGHALVRARGKTAREVADEAQNWSSGGEMSESEGDIPSDADSLDDEDNGDDGCIFYLFYLFFILFFNFFYLYLLYLFIFYFIFFNFLFILIARQVASQAQEWDTNRGCYLFYK